MFRSLRVWDLFDLNPNAFVENVKGMHIQLRVRRKLSTYLLHRCILRFAPVSLLQILCEFVTPTTQLRNFITPELYLNNTQSMKFQQPLHITSSIPPLRYWRFGMTRKASLHHLCHVPSPTINKSCSSYSERYHRDKTI